MHRIRPARIILLFREHSRIIPGRKSVCRFALVKLPIFKFIRVFSRRHTVFETDKEVLDWYEKQPRALTRDFVDSIPWRDVSSYALSPAFVPVLIYMRDVEYFTDIYYRELLRTPTGRDPIIRKFMDRWSVDENQHADLLNRFLKEAGITSHEQCQPHPTDNTPRAHTTN